MQRLWKQKFLGLLAGFAALSFSAASLEAQDTTTAGRARIDTSTTDSTRLDTTTSDTTRDTLRDTLNQNPPGYRGMEEDTSSASGDTSSVSAPGRTTSTANDSTWRDSAGLNRDKGNPYSSSRPSVTEVGADTSVTADTSKMGP